MAYGEATAANDLEAMAMPPMPVEQFAPAGPEEQFLYSQTDKPDEPLTAGAPFGPGPSSTRPYESSDQFLRRVSSVLDRTSKVPPEVKAFLDRAAAGE